MPRIIDVDGCETDARGCPGCGGESHAWGTLGTLTHFTCRDCGMQFSVKVQAEDHVVQGSATGSASTDADHRAEAERYLRDLTEAALDLIHHVRRCGIREQLIVDATDALEDVLDTEPEKP